MEADETNNNKKIGSNSSEKVPIDYNQKENAFPTNGLYKNGFHINGYPTKPIEKKSEKPKKRGGSCFWCQCVTLTLFSTLFLIAGIWLCCNSLYEYLLHDRINMQPGLPAYYFWKTPTPEVTLKVYIWNITNGDAFIRGDDEKLKMEEIGPVVFREYLTHTEVQFNENSTLSYVASKWIVFQEDRNVPGIMNRTIVVPNFATLGIASFLADKGWFINIGAKALMSTADEGPLKTITIYDFLFNYTSQVLTRAKSLAGSTFVPVENMGVLKMIYFNYSDHLNVKIGPKYKPEEFFHLKTYNHRSTVPGFRTERGDCNATILGSTEGAIYPQNLTKESYLYYWRKTLCRPAKLYFEKEVKKGDLLTYKYLLPDDAFDRITEDEHHEDCYKGITRNPLPDGISDLSRCFHNFPMAASKPHFQGRSGNWTEWLEGLSPDPEKHQSYIMVEPNMGVPVDQIARSQCNLVVDTIHGTYPANMQKFNDMILPLFWLDYHQPQLTPTITAVVDFTVNVIPAIDGYLGPVFLMLSLCLLIYLAYKIAKVKKVSCFTQKTKSFV